MTYTAIEATEWSIGTGPNGTGKRAKIHGAYTVSGDGRRVRAFSANEGGIAAAQKWADYLNENMPERRVAAPLNTWGRCCHRQPLARSSTKR